MTDPHDEYGDFLRRALHAEADAVMPSEDGLNQIRSRIKTRAARRRWPFGGASLGRIRSGSAALAESTISRLWFGEAWVRAAAAVGAAMVVALLAVSAPQTIQRIASAGHNGSSGGEGAGSGTSVTQGTQNGSNATYPRYPGLRPAQPPFGTGTPSPGATFGPPDCRSPMPVTAATGSAGQAPGTPQPCPTTATPASPTTTPKTESPPPTVPSATPAPAPDTTTSSDPAGQQQSTP